MRGGKDEEKFSNPMFPRLHVNDTDKGGPRAPPRNKMALYEQFSIPSQRFNSSSLPLPPQNVRNLGSPSSQGNGHQGTVFSPFYVSPLLPAYSAEKTNPQFSDGENVRATRMEFEKRSTSHVDFKSANAVGSIAECSSLHQRNSSNEKDSFQKRVDNVDIDDFRVPTFVNSENDLYLNKDANGIENKRKTPHANIARDGSDQPLDLEQTSISDVKSGKNERKCKEQKLNNAVVIEVQTEKALLHLEAGDKLAKPSRFSKLSSDREPASNRGLCQESCGGYITQNESQSKGPLGERTVNVRDTCNKKSGDKENRPHEQQEAYRNAEDSETSMVDSDSVSGLEISPDDVVGMIGQKQFWKARRAIVNQQRVFAVQVFELHRLIKVQKLLAASPHLLENKSCVAAPSKNPHLEPYAKPQPQSVVQKDEGSLKPSQNTDSHMESTEACPLPLYNDAVKNAPPFPPAHEIRSNPWCYPPPQHQWLVPVMSPSEGLIYKPYSAPTGFIAPVYGNYSPMSPPTPYQIHSHPQQNYYPNPYVQLMSNSAVDQTSPRPNVTAQQNSGTSCNMSLPRSDAFMARNLKARTSKDSGLQGSSASCPSQRAGEEGRNALPLFPMVPMPEALVNASGSNCEGLQTGVIRVVPHNNARSATESAARIFRSIQEGRQHHD